MPSLVLLFKKDTIPNTYKVTCVRWCDCCYCAKNTFIFEHSITIRDFRLPL